MKIQNIFIASVLSFIFVGCADEYKDGFQATKTDNAALTEFVSQFDVLKNYGGGIQIGAEVASGDVTAHSTKYSQLISNFTEATLNDVFAHSLVVNSSTGAVDSTKARSAVDDAKENGLSLFGPSLCSPSNTQTTYMKNIVADTYVPGVQTVGDFTLFDFEKDALGTLLPGWDGSTCEVVEDPDNVSGHCIHYTAAFGHTWLDVTLPMNMTLGDLVSGEYDYRTYGGGWIVQGIVKVEAAGVVSEYNPGTAAAAGIGKDEWGRGKMKIDFSKLNLSADQKKCTTFKLGIGEVVSASNFYIDNIKVTGNYFNPGHYEARPAAEKKADVTKALNSYFKTTLSNYGSDINTWIIASDAIAGGSNEDVLMSSKIDASGSKFYWNEYLGDNYVSDISKMARSFKSDLKLFYSDYNLENDAVKLERFCTMVKQWNTAGAALQGVNAEMHLVYNAANLATSKQGVSNMLKALAATGLQVRLSGLDMIMTDAGGLRIKTADLTIDQLKAMSDYYNYVISQYMTIVPQSQRYGISLASFNGTDGYTIGFWDQNFNRRATYAGIANGLQSVTTEWIDK